MNERACAHNAGPKETVAKISWSFEFSVFEIAPFLAVCTIPPNRRKRRVSVDGILNRRKKKETFSNLTKPKSGLSQLSDHQSSKWRRIMLRSLARVVTAQLVGSRLTLCLVLSIL